MAEPKYQITSLPDLPGVDCPCGETRRAFVDDPDRTASIHLVEVSKASKTHYHRRLTEVYYVVEGRGQIELDGELHPLAPGVAVLIKPGCRHRAFPADGESLRLLNIPVPAFDPKDEWFD